MTASQIPKEQQKAWNSFQAKMRTLRKQQREILQAFRQRLEHKKMDDIRKDNLL